MSFKRVNGKSQLLYIIQINLTDEVCILFIVHKCLIHKISYTELVALTYVQYSKKRLVKIMKRFGQEM